VSNKPLTSAFGVLKLKPSFSLNPAVFGGWASAAPCLMVENSAAIAGRTEQDSGMGRGWGKTGDSPPGRPGV